MRRRDSAQALAVGIAAATALLVAGGLALSAFGELGSTGWGVVVLVAAAIALLVAAREPGRVVPVLLAMVALGLAVGALALSRGSAIDHARETRFTQLWLVERGSAGRAEIGVRNEEHTRAAYRLQVFGPESAGAALLVDRTIVLDPSRSWSGELVIPRTPRPERVNAELYRLGEAESYRSAHLWTAPAP
jgi:hypothetical protein